MHDAPLPAPEQLYDAAPCGLLLAAADGRVLDANATLCAWLRCSKGDLVGKVRFSELLTVGGRIFWQTHLQPLLRMQASVAEVKLEMRWADGPVLPVMVNAVERAWQGRVVQHVAVFVAEERHKYERELLLQRQRAEELAAQHARDQQALAAVQAEAMDRAAFAEQLVGIVSHDIRNPLSVIQMSAILLDRGVNAEQQKASVARINRAVQRVQHLIGDLLDFTQVRVGGGLGIRKVPEADLHQAVADTVAELAVGFPDCVLRHERIGTGHCEADADRIVQAVGNLVANAVNHGDKRQPVTVRTEDAPGVFRISVHNGGAPIPPQLLPTLFEPMVRGAAPGAKGVGLGLYIVRAVVQAHGGQVAARSSAEEGTTFRMELPCA
ncbi:PAS domain-containing sensor histidine kinase [Ramlibacter sp. AN1133]|uniref:PAS domain-containing sensor histidine kinase n=1 Tax=Ramlibacter sp. AN1133 TaxID=3133429 RepID=UPI0030C16D7F